VELFQAGQYEDDFEMNSTWATGDWNGDFDFNSRDLVLAFQNAGYEIGPRVAIKAVPEPAFVFVTLLTLLVSFRRFAM
jgi:hypothetical protein